LTDFATVSGDLPQEPDAGDVADTLFDQLVSLTAHQSIAVEESQRHHARQLHRLFLEGHLGEQLVRAPEVLVRRHGFALRVRQPQGR
jgi:hypothetical protein